MTMENGDLVAASPDPAIDAAEPRKPAQRILEDEISEGLGELERASISLFIAGLSAGLDIGFSFLLIAIVLTRTEGVLPAPVVDILVASSYSLGFIFVVLGRSELFTEHTTLATLPVLSGRASLPSLAKLWGIVYISNLLGAAIFAALLTLLGPALGVVEEQVFGEVAREVVHFRWWVILLSAVFAGWLMGLLSWLVAAGRDTISQIAVIYLVTATIGYAHLHHSIVGSVEVLAGVFSGQGISLLDYGHFLLWATLGNSIGGVVFVAIIKYGHAIHSDFRIEDIRLNGRNAHRTSARNQ